jgi:hypothetical protein
MTRKTKNNNMDATSMQHICYLYAPLMQQFRSNLKKNVANSAQTWLPIECNLILRYEFATLTTHTRYIFVAILLYCGARGTDEIPEDTAFLANALAVDARTIPKSLEELKNAKLLLEREKEREEKEQTDRKKESASARVSVSSGNLSQNENENEEKEVVQKNGEGNTSSFSLEECRRYVEAEIKDGATIQNANALAMKLFKTGQADGFIKARLYPEQATLDQYGEPVKFSEYPCKVCFGAKQAEIDGNRFGKCTHCKNEKGQPTGFEPISEDS